MEAMIKIGLLSRTPGNAKLDHTASKPIRYKSRPRVFQVARVALGTYSKVSWLFGDYIVERRTNLMVFQSEIFEETIVSNHIVLHLLNLRLIFEVKVTLDESLIEFDDLPKS